MRRTGDKKNFTSVPPGRSSRYSKKKATCRKTGTRCSFARGSGAMGGGEKQQQRGQGRVQEKSWAEKVLSVVERYGKKRLSHQKRKRLVKTVNPKIVLKKSDLSS